METKTKLIVSIVTALCIALLCVVKIQEDEIHSLQYKIQEREYVLKSIEMMLDYVDEKREIEKLMKKSLKQ